MAVIDGSLLITSAAYADDSICVEIGRIPPSFLPLGNRRLYNHQLEALRGHFRNTYISLPESFTVSQKDLANLSALNCEIIYVPDDLSLGQSVLYAVSQLPDSPLGILHGDTLIQDIRFNCENGVTVHTSHSPYQWASVMSGESDDTPIVESSEDSEREVLSGFFLFSRRSLLCKCLCARVDDFISAINLYSTSEKLDRLESGQWFDFGHFHTYYRSKTHLTTQRSFNGLIIEEHTVTKASKDTFKMHAEAEWLRNTPPKLKLFTPAVLSNSCEKGKYTVERLMLPTLSDILVFGRLNETAWSTIFSECNRFLNTARKFTIEKKISELKDDLYLSKTLKRLKSVRELGIDIEKPITFNNKAAPSILEIAHTAQEIIDDEIGSKSPQSIMHGDFCFSNILFDSRASAIKVIDPRGYTAPGVHTIYGDPRYDIGKLAHSAIGHYDQIIGGYFEAKHQDQSLELEIAVDSYSQMAESAFKVCEFGPTKGDDPILKAIQIHLFLSMVPLHSDNRQRQIAFLANAFRVFSQL